MNVGVFCSSSDKVSPMLLAEAEALGETLARLGHSVVYGGATPGCMGALARGVLHAKGKLIGVVPEMDFMAKIVEPGLSETHVVPTLSSRKEKMNALSEAFLVYPGGLGTLDEAFEVLALKSLGTLKKPLIIYNFLGVWTPLIQALDLLMQQNLIRDSLDDLAAVIDKREDIREHLRHVL